jgi:hypothetical protein
MPYKIAWMAVTIVLPVFGVALYLIFGGNRISGRRKKKMRFMQEALEKAAALAEPEQGGELVSPSPGDEPEEESGPVEHIPGPRRVR